MERQTTRGLADVLDADLRRWLEEAARGPIRSTLEGGILGQAAVGSENLLRHAVGVLRVASPEIVNPALERLAPNKSLDRLTFGQMVKVIEQVAKVGKLSAGGSIAGAPDVRRLNRLAKLRNDHAHGRLDPRHENPHTVEFLKTAHELCAGLFIDNVHRLETADDTLMVRRAPKPVVDATETKVDSHTSVRVAVVVGRKYLYTEDWEKLEVRVLADESTHDSLVYRLEVTRVLRGESRHEGQIYTVDMSRDARFAGMWALHPIEN
jgi:hypothetical protein